jgi:phosphoribosylaminoimidazole synthetase
MLPRKDIQAGDVLLGLASSGCHSNGFSLVRKTLEHAGVSYDDPAPWDPSTTTGRSLLAPTKIYCKAFLAAHKEGLIKAASHITGGGFLENIPRMLPASLSARVHASTWKAPSVFRWLAKAGNIQSEELAKTLNMGIGMVLIVSAQNKQSAILALRHAGEEVYEIGKLERRDEGTSQCIVEGWNVWTA